MKGACNSFQELAGHHRSLRVVNDWIKPLFCSLSFYRSLRVVTGACGSSRKLLLVLHIYVYMYVCMCVYIYIFVNVYVYVYVHLCIYMYIYIINILYIIYIISIYLPLSLHIYIDMYTHTQVLLLAHTYIHAERLSRSLALCFTIQSIRILYIIRKY
jgi:hypothetical protein